MKTDAVTWFIIVLLMFGLVVGALGRLAVPGPNPMGVFATVAVGIGGALLGGLVGLLLFDRAGGVVMSVLGAAVIVWVLERNRSAIT